MRKTVRLLVVFYLLMNLSPADMVRTTGGKYYAVLNVAWCTSTYTCIHEAGHILDHELGDISQSEAYAEALNSLTDVGWMEYVRTFVNMGDYPGYNRYKEIYAELYYWHIVEPGMIPVDLVRFYEEEK